MTNEKYFDKEFDYAIVFDKISQVTKNYLGLFQDFDASNKDVVFTGAIFRQLYNSGSEWKNNDETKKSFDVFKSKILKALKALYSGHEIQKLSQEENLFSHSYRELYNQLSKYFCFNYSKNPNRTYDINVHNDKIWEKWFSILKTLCEEPVIIR